MNPMEMSVRGLVCRNSHCSNYRSSHLFPRANFPVPEQKTDLKKTPEKCCPKALFDIKKYFESMEFIGSLKSRSNQYYCYEHDDVFLALTGLKELTRFNAIRERDLSIIENLIRDQFEMNPFGAQELRNTCLLASCDSPRLNEIIYLERQGKAEHNELYWLMLSSCYLLTAKGILTLEKQGRGVRFVLNRNQDLFLSDENVYSQIRFLANINENTAAFEMDPFYLEVRCNGYRGSIVPYIKEEIDYLDEFIAPLRPKHRLDILQLRDSMDYSHRFHRLYDLLGWRNLRNEREELEYFERRIKSALELVAKLKGTVKSDKEGRIKVFYKR